jgi:F-type H+-transporting ATPase subunit a
MFSRFASETAGPHISIAPETIFTIGPFVVTNSQILSIVGLGVLAWLFARTVREIRSGKMGRISSAVLWLFENLYDTCVEVIGDKRVVKKILPLAITIVFFFVINNWLGLLPVVGPITYNDVPIFRGAAADLNMTLAVAVISIVTAQLWAIKRRGFIGNAKRYLFNPFKEPLHFFIGLLEIVAEFSRTAALALRMFGNVFGGEVLLVVIAFLTGYASAIALPIFYGLELFVGAVQAYVFFMLTIAFVSLALPGEDEEHGHEPAPSKPLALEADGKTSNN